MGLNSPIPGSYFDINVHPQSNIAVKALRCARTDETYMDKVTPIFKDVLMPIWSLPPHERIVPLLAICHSPPSLKAPHNKEGNIVEYNRRHLEVNKMQQIAQIAAGLSYLHEHDIVHGNICPANVLIKDDGGVCVSDATLNTLMRQLTYDTHVPVPGTWCYKSSEELTNGTPMGPKSDVYSWACTVFEVFSGKQPYYGYYHGRGIVKIVNEGHRALDRPPEITTALWNIMQKCWALNSEDRPSMRQVESELRGL